MRAARLTGRHRRRRARTTAADPAATPTPNLVARDFAAPPPPDRLWSVDIAYVATGEGWPSLAVLLDAHSRRVVGWALADHLRAELALEALAMALAARRPATGPVHHPGRGCQHTAEAHRSALAAGGVTVSMSRAGNCDDNAMAERFFATRKAEVLDGRPWPTRRAAPPAILAWLDVLCNRQRRPSALGFRNPVACALARATEARAA